jgi:hypothetical protein
VWLGWGDTVVLTNNLPVKKATDRETTRPGFRARAGMERPRPR